jgi:hypothetical protein
MATHTTAEIDALASALARVVSNYSK